MVFLSSGKITRFCAFRKFFPENIREKVERRAVKTEKCSKKWRGKVEICKRNTGDAVLLLPVKLFLEF